MSGNESTGRVVAVIRPDNLVPFEAAVARHPASGSRGLRPLADVVVLADRRASR
jgi:hypothetical protein